MNTEFAGKGSPISSAGFTAAADSLGVKAPELWAVFHVETRGFGFLADKRPQILFERHVFHKLTKGQFSVKYPDISNKTPGGYGVGGVQQYVRLQKAIALDRDAALRSASWGVGQVMGFNAGSAGFADVETMVAEMSDSEDMQLAAVAAFLRSTKLDGALRTHNWADFARGYNGSNYADNRYDTQLQSAYQQFVAGGLPDLRVRRAQAALGYCGYDPQGIDGQWGKFSRAALAEFQQKNGLKPTGILDDKSENSLLAKAGLN
jgi:hypothetical protein